MSGGETSTAVRLRTISVSASRRPRPLIKDEPSRYRAGVTADRGSLADIGRSAAGVIAELLATPGGPAVVTVAADAGAGKTALLGQVLDDLLARAAADPGG